MKTTHFFSYFCSVQHRLAVSPQAAALFFFILGELSASGFKSYCIAMANSRICGTIHISPATLRKCRDELIAAGIIGFSSNDNGKTISLYTLIETDQWKLDVVELNSTSTSATCQTPVSLSDSRPTPASAPIPEPTFESAPTSASVVTTKPLPVKKKPEKLSEQQPSGTPIITRASILQQKIRSVSKILSARAPRWIKLVDRSSKTPSRHFRS